MSRVLLALLVTILFITMPACNAATATGGGALPNPIIDAPLATTKSEQTAVIAGGCFWGVQAVFQHVKGVISVSAGYSGGAADTAHYEMVSEGNTGHAESVRIKYDPSRISYGQLLKVYFAVAHDPTELNRQGPDTGTQYRSEIFYSNAEQQRIAEAYVAQLNKAGVFKRPIVTQVVALKAFYEAEAYHQDYAQNHPDEPYIAINDLPKVAELRKQLPELYVGN
ncbi:MAG TPA: peptide-methionine (S)-S-oxide reductase MsrA [Pyrinomonadaceae bacterium]|nr:peptide-methionine (S)-S-oxide reductase MsrA [Pyrinomonadaceae bacterium]